MTDVQSTYFTFGRSVDHLVRNQRRVKTLKLGEIEDVQDHGSESGNHGGFAVKKFVQRARKTTEFGQRLREKRLEKKITLRSMADMIGVSSTYLSQVEQGRYDPPTADRVRDIAKILGEDADLWIGLADRVPEDMEEIVKEHPKEMPELLRAARGLSPEQFEKLQQTIKRMREKGE